MRRVRAFLTASVLLLGCGGSVRLEEAAATSGAGGGSIHAGSTGAGGIGGGDGGDAACPIGQGHVLGGPEAETAASVAASASGARVFSVASSGLVTATTPITLDGAPQATLATSGVVVVELDAAGKIAWARPIQGRTPEWTFPFPVAIDASGDVIVGGCFFGTVDLGDGVSASTPAYGVFVSKLSAEGDPLWIRGFPDDAEECLADLKVDPAGDVFVLGAGGVDFGSGALAGEGFVAKLDPSGAVLWAKAYEGAGLEAGGHHHVPFSS